jgi:hypothetical protein
MADVADCGLFGDAAKSKAEPTAIVAFNQEKLIKVDDWVHVFEYFSNKQDLNILQDIHNQLDFKYTVVDRIKELITADEVAQTQRIYQQFGEHLKELLCCRQQLKACSAMAAPFYLAKLFLCKTNIEIFIKSSNKTISKFGLAILAREQHQEAVDDIAACIDNEGGSPALL